MTKEQQPPEAQGFVFSENERLFDRIRHERLIQLLKENTTTIHEVSVSHNNYGEYLFVTASRPRASERHCVTFWGQGYVRP